MPNIIVIILIINRKVRIYLEVICDELDCEWIVK